MHFLLYILSFPHWLQNRVLKNTEIFSQKVQKRIQYYTIKMTTEYAFCKIEFSPWRGLKFGFGGKASSPTKYSSILMLVPGMFLIRGTMKSPELNTLSKLQLPKNCYRFHNGLPYQSVWNSSLPQTHLTSLLSESFCNWNTKTGGDLMRQCFTSMLPIQLDISQMLLNSSAIRSHSSEVGTAKYTYIGCSTFQMALPDSWTMPCIVFIPTRKQ